MQASNYPLFLVISKKVTFLWHHSQSTIDPISFLIPAPHSNCKVHFDSANFLQVPSTSSPRTRSISPINQNTKTSFFVFHFAFEEGRKIKSFETRGKEKKESFKVHLKGKGNAKRRINLISAWRVERLLKFPRFISVAVVSEPRYERIFAEAISRTARTHPAPVAISYSTSPRRKRRKNDDATDKKSHSFIAARRLISILIRFGISSMLA